MSKHILVCLPISAEQRARIEAVQGFASHAGADILQHRAAATASSS